MTREEVVTEVIGIVADRISERITRRAALSASVYLLQLDRTIPRPELLAALLTHCQAASRRVTAQMGVYLDAGDSGWFEPLIARHATQAGIDAVNEILVLS